MVVAAGTAAVALAAAAAIWVTSGEDAQPVATDASSTSEGPRRPTLAPATSAPPTTADTQRGSSNPGQTAPADPSGSLDANAAGVRTNVSCPADIASDVTTRLGRADAGFLQARYQAGNFVIHVCTGSQGPVYHGQNTTNADMIVLPATGDVSTGFTAANGVYTYAISDVSLIIRSSGNLIQENPVTAHEIY